MSEGTKKDPWEDLEKMTQTSLKDLEAEEGREFLVMVPHGWGRDKNAHKAFRTAKKNVAYAKGLTKALLLDVPEGAWVDGMGTVRWEDGDQEVRQVGYTEFTT